MFEELGLCAKEFISIEGFGFVLLQKQQVYVLCLSNTESMWLKVLLLVLVWAVSPVVMVSYSYYIVPSNHSETCSFEGFQIEDCFTLQELSEITSVQNALRQLLMENGTLTLIFAPGKHVHTGSITIANLTRVILKGEIDGNGMPQITCEQIPLSCFFFYYTSEIYIETLIFTGCISENIFGGAIYAQGATFFTVNQSQFVNNTVRTRGGSFVLLDTENVYILQSIFVNNSALCHPSNIGANSACLKSNQGSGGAISLLECHFVVIEDSNFDMNVASCSGGAISSISTAMVIHTTTFNCNKVVANKGFGGAAVLIGDNVLISESLFEENQAHFGGAMSLFNLESTNSLHLITNSTLKQNQAVAGGAVEAGKLMLQVSDCLFVFNKADHRGGGIDLLTVNLSMENTVFRNNTGREEGGALSLYNSRQSSIANSTFCNNNARCGGAIHLFGTKLDCTTPPHHMLKHIKIIHSTFMSNTAQWFGGAIYVNNEFVEVTESNFNNNTGLSGGAIAFFCSVCQLTGNLFTRSSVTIHGTLSVESYDLKLSLVLQERISNQAPESGGAIYAYLSNVSSTQCLYSRNRASGSGGALFFFYGIANITEDVFFKNTADTYVGSALYQTGESIQLHNTMFNENENNLGSQDQAYTVQLTNVYGQCRNLTFSNNFGSMYLFNSRINFSGVIYFTNNTGITGAALTLVQSTMIFEGLSVVRISNNSATYGGGGFLSRSNFIIHTTSSFVASNNSASISGGGICSYQSEITIKTVKGLVLFQGNEAVEGGGIHCIASTLNMLGGEVLFATNKASEGGAVFLAQNSNIYIKKASPEILRTLYVTLTFSGNIAEYGGALYVRDTSISSGLCTINHSNILTSKTTDGECFLQTLGLYYPVTYFKDFTKNNYFNVLFDINHASISGSDIFGGMLDRCQSNPAAEVYTNFNLTVPLNGFNYIKTITQFHIDIDYNQFKHSYDPHRIAETITKEHVKGHVSSSALQLCLCMNEAYNCSYQYPLVFRKRGERFSVSVVTVDQIENVVNGTVIATVVSSGTQLKVDQSRQVVNGVCTELFYNVYSTRDNATIQLYPDGPCNNTGISSKELNIIFLHCECPRGLQPAPIDNECRCECDSNIDAIISQCLFNNDNLTVVRRNEDLWIQYVNNINSSTGFMYSECPFDYCLVEPVNLSFSLPSQVDTQCAHNRSGVLCGECEEGLSLVFGSSRCRLCTNTYIALLIAFAVAGIALVVLILILNLTVSVGTIHGLILYANIVAANSPIFLRSDTALRLFVSWVNLDLGIETCFYDGMDSYAKVLLQLVFPAYVISLSVLIIVTSFYWGRFAGLIGRKNPVATLCTLFLLSYSKLLRIIISGLQFAQLTYPSGVTEILWLYNPNISYFIPSRIPMFIFAGVIIILGTIYTILLFFGQWLRKLQKVKCLQSTKYNAFIDAYHAPFRFKHRYWIGVLLLTRIIHHLLTAVLSNSTYPLMVSCLMCTLLIFKLVITGVFKNWSTDFLETTFLFNLLLFAVSTYYVSLTKGNQASVANTSVTVAFITFCGIILFHTHTFALKGFRIYSNVCVTIQDYFQVIKTRCVQRYKTPTTTTLSSSNDLRANLLREPALDVLAPISSRDYIPPTPNVSSAVPRPCLVATSFVDVTGEGTQNE